MPSRSGLRLPHPARDDSEGAQARYGVEHRIRRRTALLRGGWISRAMVADVAMPSAFARLPGLRIDVGGEPVRIGGWAFRGLLNLEV